MTGIVVVNGDPIERRAKVALHLRHQGAGGGLQIPQRVRIFSRQCQPELMAVIAAALDKTPTINLLAFASIYLTATAITLNPIALNIAYMLAKGPRTSAASNSCNMNFDNDPPYAHPSNTANTALRLWHRPIAAPDIAP
jgi:hypothetical protein